MLFQVSPPPSLNFVQSPVLLTVNMQDNQLTDSPATMLISPKTTASVGDTFSLNDTVFTAQSFIANLTDILDTAPAATLTDAINNHPDLNKTYKARLESGQVYVEALFPGPAWNITPQTTTDSPLLAVDTVQTSGVAANTGQDIAGLSVWADVYVGVAGIFNDSSLFDAHKLKPVISLSKGFQQAGIYVFDLGPLLSRYIETVFPTGNGPWENPIGGYIHFQVSCGYARTGNFNLRVTKYVSGICTAVLGINKSTFQNTDFVWVNNQSTVKPLAENFKGLPIARNQAFAGLAFWLSNTTAGFANITSFQPTVTGYANDELLFGSQLANLNTSTDPAGLIYAFSGLTSLFTNYPELNKIVLQLNDSSGNPVFPANYPACEFEVLPPEMPAMRTLAFLNAFGVFEFMPFVGDWSVKLKRDSHWIPASQSGLNPIIKTGSWHELHLQEQLHTHALDENTFNRLLDLLASPRVYIAENSEQGIVYQEVEINTYHYECNRETRLYVLDLQISLLSAEPVLKLN